MPCLQKLPNNNQTIKTKLDFKTKSDNLKKSILPTIINTLFSSSFHCAKSRIIKITLITT